MIEFNNAKHGERIAAAAGTTFNPFVDVSIAAVTQQGNLLGGVVFTGYTQASIGMHAAAFDRRWASIDMLWVTFHYPFVQLNCKKIFAQVPASNSKALEFDKKLGFKEEARIKDVFPDGDLVVLAMLREDCKWLGIKPRLLKEPADGWKVESSASS